MRDARLDASRLHALFVYGTLRQGFSNHYLLEGAVFQGFARTTKRYSLFAERIPYVSKAAAVLRIFGEVFLVDGKTLGLVDRLEGHPD